MLVNFEDVKQDLILKLISILKDIDLSRFPADDSDSLTRYIAVCIKNEYIALSKKRSKELINVIKGEDFDVIELVFSRLDNDFISDIEVDDFLKVLSEKQRKVIVYKFVYMLSDVEIGEILNISRQAVNRLLNRGLKLLREDIKR